MAVFVPQFHSYASARILGMKRSLEMISHGSTLLHKPGISCTTFSDHWSTLAAVGSNLRAGSYDDCHRIAAMSVIVKATSRLELPAMNSKFSVQCHPEYELVRKECDDWTLSLFNPPLDLQDPRRLSYLQGLYPLFTCVLFPSTPSRRRLILICKLINWLFVLDDIIDEVDLPTAAELQDNIVALLTSSNSSHLPANSTEYPCLTPLGNKKRVTAFVERLHQDVWDEMCRDMLPGFKRRLVQSMVTSLGAGREEMRLRRLTSQTDAAARAQAVHQHMKTVDDFMAVRMWYSFVDPLLLLMEYGLGIDTLEASAAAHGVQEQLDDLKLAGARHIVWVNDLLSFQKEVMKDEGSISSIVGYLYAKRAAVATESGGALQALQVIMNEVWSMVKEQEQHCARILENIEAQAGGCDELVSYSQELCRGLAGNIYWSTLTARYQGFHPLPWNTPTSISIDPTLLVPPSLNFLHDI